MDARAHERLRAVDELVRTRSFDVGDRVEPDLGRSAVGDDLRRLVRERIADVIDEFVDCIRNKKTPLINLKWHKQTIQAMLGCYESIESGKIAKVG